VKTALDRRRRLAWGVSGCFYALIVAVLFHYLRSLDLDALLSLEIRRGALVAALAVGLLHRFLMAWVWMVILGGFGVSLTRPGSLNLLYAKSWLGRYLPGKVTGVAARVYFADAVDVDRGAVALSSAVETGIHLLVSIAIGLIGLGLSDQLSMLGGPVRSGALCLGVAVLLALLPRNFNRVTALLFRALGQRERVASHRVTLRTMARGLAAALGAHLAAAACFMLFAQSVSQVAGWHDFVFVWGTFSIAGALGMLAFFAPAGLGVRESAPLPFLTLVMSAEAAVALLVLLRLGDVAVDLVYFGASRVVARSGRRGPPPVIRDRA
jgi:hypothetical protein